MGLVHCKIPIHVSDQCINTEKDPFQQRFVGSQCRFRPSTFFHLIREGFQLQKYRPGKIIAIMMIPSSNEVTK
jgi:hypothetical protein